MHTFSQAPKWLKPNVKARVLTWRESPDEGQIARDTEGLLLAACGHGKLTCKQRAIANESYLLRLKMPGRESELPAVEVGSRTLNYEIALLQGVKCRTGAFRA